MNLNINWNHNVWPITDLYWMPVEKSAGKSLVTVSNEDVGQESVIVARMMIGDGVQMPGKHINNYFYTSYNGQAMDGTNSGFQVTQHKGDRACLLTYCCLINFQNLQLQLNCMMNFI